MQAGRHFDSKRRHCTSHPDGRGPAALPAHDRRQARSRDRKV